MPIATAQRRPSSASMNACRRPASSQRVNSSSNWSTTTSRPGSSATSSVGFAPGVSSHRVARSRRPRRTRTAAIEAGAQYRGLAAARRADDGEQPAGCDAARRGPRPPLRGRRRWRGRRPRTRAGRGTGTRLADGVRTPGPSRARTRSRDPASVSRCRPRSTSEQPSGRCAATSSAVTADSRISPPSASARTRAARLTVGPK